MNWENIPIHVIDFEGSKETGIVEYGIATLLNKKIVQTHTRLCGTTQFIPEEESAIHGIYNEDIKSFSPVNNDWDIFSNLRKSGLFGSHFSPAEIGMLTAVWITPGLVPDFSIQSCPQTNSWGPWVDTCKIAKTWFPKEKSHKLGTLIERFELTEDIKIEATKHCPQNRNHYHCALFDAIAAALLLVNMCEHPAFKQSNILDLIAASMSAKNFENHRQGGLSLF